MSREQSAALIRATGIIAIMRASSTAQMLAAVEALWRGGVRAMEVSLTTPGALDLIAAVTARDDQRESWEDDRRESWEDDQRESWQHGADLLFGAGTVLSAADAEAAIRAGAGFVVSPTLNLEVVAVCRQHDVVVLPGCFTPTEMQTAWEAGADLIKLFPASLGGPALLKALLAPLPHLPLVPVGGVTVDNAGDYIRHGAVAVGVGSSLVSPALLAAGDMEGLTRRAADLVALVRKARELRPDSSPDGKGNR